MLMRLHPNMVGSQIKHVGDNNFFTDLVDQEIPIVSKNKLMVQP